VNEQNKLQRLDPQAVERAQPITSGDPGSMLAIIARAAQDPATDTNKMRELLAIRREIQAEEDKRLFYEAMAEFQSRCPVIVKTKSVMNKDGRTVRYKFAPLDSIIAQTKDLIREVGFSFAIDAEVKEKMVTATCKITHRGHSITSTFTVPIDMEAHMNLPQKYASALTFAKRYAFTNGFGIMTADEDADGDQGGTKPTKDDAADRKAVAAEIWSMFPADMRRAGNWADINQWLWARDILDGGAEEAMPGVPIKRMREVLAKVKEQKP
jgi:hypothetical protein